MSAANQKGGASRPSPFRGLFASLRIPSQQASPPAPPPAVEPTPAPRLLPGSGSKARQASLLEVSTGRQGDRVVAMQDFIARLKRQMAKSNIGRNDPLAPVLELLGEMLLHFTHLAEDTTDDLAGHTDRILAEAYVVTERTRGLFAESLRSVEGVMTRLAERSETAVARIGSERRAAYEHLSSEAAALLTGRVIHHSRQQIWIERTLVGAVIVGLIGGAYVIGQDNGRDQMQVAVQATGDRLNAAVLQDGPATAMKWVKLIEWNRLAGAPTTCGRQPNGYGYRVACTYLLWNGPPNETPPPTVAGP